MFEFEDWPDMPKTYDEKITMIVSAIRDWCIVNDPPESVLDDYDYWRFQHMSIINAFVVLICRIKALELELSNREWEKLSERKEFDEFDEMMKGMLEMKENVSEKEDVGGVIINHGQKDKESGFEDDPYYVVKEPCRDPSHEPPTHLVIPAGKRYRHVCPSCGRVVYVRSQNVVTFLG